MRINGQAVRIVMVAGVALLSASIWGQNAPAPSSSLQQNVNTSYTITVSNQSAFNGCYVPAAAEMSANPGCNLNPDGSGTPGELVDLAGTITFNSHYEQDPKTGSWHMKQVTHTELTGVGECSGVKYTEKDNSNWDTALKFDINGDLLQQDFMDVEKVKLISQGKLPNMTLTTRTHVIIDAQGVVHYVPNQGSQGMAVEKCTK